MNAKAKFIQIVSDTDSLNALDEEGRVWTFDYARRIWCALSAERDPREKEEWRREPGRRTP